jgi:fumarylpyruvate hydrolase
MELVLAIGKGGANITAADAASHVFGLAAGIDLTRRDLQFKARDAGRPWETGKAFDRSAPISAIHPLRGALPRGGRIWLKVNGAIKQDGDLKEMIWPCDDIVAQLSALFELMPGDLIYTGTPAGVGKIGPGDRIEGGVDGVDIVTLSIL